MLQKLPAAAFTATVKLEFAPQSVGEQAGLVLFGLDYSYIGISKSEKGLAISHFVCMKSDKGSPEETTESVAVPTPEVFFRVDVRPENAPEVIPRVLCSFSYSTDGTSYHPIGKTFIAREGQWVGAKVGVFSLSPYESTQSGNTDLDWFRIQPITN